MSQYRPGQVAVATVLGVEGVRILRSTNIHGKDFWVTDRPVATPDVGWMRCFASDDEVTDVRPFVVLDPRDWANSADLSEAADYLESNGWNGSAKVLRHIVEQTKPPRIDEPTEPLAEVMASTYNRERRRFVRGVQRPDGTAVRWVDGVHSWTWAELIDPTLIPERAGS